MGFTIKREQYTSDYVLGDYSFSAAPFRKYDEQIAKFQETKLNLEKLRDFPNQTDEMKSKIQEVIDSVEHYISEFEEIRHKKFEVGVYKRQWNTSSGIKSQFIKRVEGDNCDDCVFRHMPCLGIRSHYGCYTTPECSPNNDIMNGDLIKTGHFIEIEPIEMETINLEQLYGESN